MQLGIAAVQVTIPDGGGALGNVAEVKDHPFQKTRGIWAKWSVSRASFT